MKKFFLIGIVLSVFMVSCDFNKMPHEPGIFCNDELLTEKNNNWKKNPANNYSYSYGYKSSFENFKLDVLVEDGKVIDYVLKEYWGQTKDTTSENGWNECEEIFDTSFEDKDLFLIDNVFKDFFSIVEDAKTTYKKNPDCYYAKIEFTYSDDAPYVLSCKAEKQIMKANLLDGNSVVEICISNFTTD